MTSKETLAITIAILVENGIHGNTIREAVNKVIETETDRKLEEAHYRIKQAKDKAIQDAEVELQYAIDTRRSSHRAIVDANAEIDKNNVLTPGSVLRQSRDAYSL